VQSKVNDIDAFSCMNPSSFRNTIKIWFIC
jgi:hypothetical protein